MQGSGGGADGKDYAGMFNGFFEKPNMASTYKPVFLGALVDIAAGKTGVRLPRKRGCDPTAGGRMRIDLDLVAVPFAGFYWDMVAALNPRHTPARMADPDDPGRDIAIVGLINDEIARMKEEEARRGFGDGVGAGQEGSSAGRRRGVGIRASDRPPTPRRLASNGMAEFRKKVVSRSIKPEVLRHLPGKKFRPYEFRRGEDSIVLEAGMIEYMRRNAFALKAALGGLIAVHLEENNPSARHIATVANLNKKYGARIKKADELALRAMPQRLDVEPLYRASLDLARDRA